MRHLLHHTSGLRDYLSLQPIAGWPEDMLLTEGDFLALVSRQKGLNFAPGTKHLYSNTGYVLLSLIVRKVSGLSLREFAAKELFTPLGMTNTVFRDNHTTTVPRRATAYEPLASGGFRTRVPGFDVAGDGGLFSTAEDLAKWDPTALDVALNAPGLSALMVTPGASRFGRHTHLCHGTVFRYLSWTADRAAWWYIRRLSRRIHRSTIGRCDHRDLVQYQNGRTLRSKESHH